MGNDLVFEKEENFCERHDAITTWDQQFTGENLVIYHKGISSSQIKVSSIVSNFYI